MACPKGRTTIHVYELPMPAPAMQMMPPVFLTPVYSAENTPTYDKPLAKGDTEHLLTNEQYVDGAKVELVEIG